MKLIDADRLKEQIKEHFFDNLGVHQSGLELALELIDKAPEAAEVLTAIGQQRVDKETFERYKGDLEKEIIREAAESMAAQIIQEDCLQITKAADPWRNQILYIFKAEFLKRTGGDEK